MFIKQTFNEIFSRFLIFLIFISCFMAVFIHIFTNKGIKYGFRTHMEKIRAQISRPAPLSLFNSKTNRPMKNLILITKQSFFNLQKTCNYEKCCNQPTEEPHGRGFRFLPKGFMFLLVNDLRFDKCIGLFFDNLDNPVTPSVFILHAPSVVMYRVALHPYAHAVTDKYAVGMEHVLAQSVVYLHDAHVLRHFPFCGAGT